MKKKYLIISIVAVLLISLGLTYAYYQARVRGTGTNMVIQTKELKIIFTDNNEIPNTLIEPGWEVSKTFTVENTTNETFTYNIYIDNLVNTFTTNGYLQYKIVGNNSGLNMPSFVDIPKHSIGTNQIIGKQITIAALTTQSYTIYFHYLNDPDFDQSEDMGMELSGKLAIKKYGLTLEDKVLANNQTRLTRTDFSSTLTTTNTGTLYTTTSTEDSSTVYYFAGDARNNWVVFGQETKDNVTYDICWRIIRTNTNLEGNGLRLLYSGVYDSSTQECGNTITGYIGRAQYGTLATNPSLVGYMRSDGYDLDTDRLNELDSPVKIKIDTWYKDNTNLVELTKDYINIKVIYCNDRSISIGTYDTSNYYFGAYGRLESKRSPSLRCGANTGSSATAGLYESIQAIADKFTVDASTGNGNLTFPVALMTADEISFAGGGSVLWGQLPSPYAWYFKNKNNSGVAATDSITGDGDWWTLTPSYTVTWGDCPSCVRMYSVGRSSKSGRLGAHQILSNMGLRPVVSLTADVQWNSGNGSFDNPYTVK